MGFLFPQKPVIMPPPQAALPPTLAAPKASGVAAAARARAALAAGAGFGGTVKTGSQGAVPTNLGQPSLIGGGA